jgi:hypothetical protein
MARAPWYVAGPLFGLLIGGLRAALNKPFGALGGYIDAGNVCAAARGRGRGGTGCRRSAGNHWSVRREQ